jgi:GntR family transcriptional regulator, transcriptional repressor for pyruvate dehydrogenase complex
MPPSDALRPVGSRSTADEVAEQIRALIHRGELASGDRLPAERELAAQLGVARLTLREALSALQEEGYLVARRGATGGTFVTDLQRPRDRWVLRMREDLADLEDIIEFRIAVERRAAKLACRRRTRADLAELRDSVAFLESARDIATFRSADAQFHACVARAARSPRLAQAVGEARGELFLPTDFLDYRPAVATTSREHGAIVEAIRLRDADLAADLVERHIEGTRVWLRRYVTRRARALRS